MVFRWFIIISATIAAIEAGCYKEFAHTQSYGGVEISGASGLEACKTACDNDNGCYGFDFSNNKCWSLTTRNMAQYDNNDVNQYIKEPCSSGCYKEFEHTISYGGVEISGAIGLEACKAACDLDTGCYGFDFSNNKCWSLTTPNMAQYDNNDVNQYIKEQCGSNEGSTVDTTWTEWSACPSCGRSSFKWRYRPCSSQSHTLGSADCPIKTYMQSENCNLSPCPGGSVSNTITQQTWATESTSFLAAAAGSINAIASMKEAFDSKKTVGKIARALGNLSPVVDGILAVINIAFNFLETAEDALVRYLDEKFEEIHNRFDSLSAELTKMSNEIQLEQCRGPVAQYSLEITGNYDKFLAMNKYEIGSRRGEYYRQFIADYEAKSMDDTVKHLLEAMYSTHSLSICREAFWSVLATYTDCSISKVEELEEAFDNIFMAGVTVYIAYHTLQDTNLIARKDAIDRVNGWFYNAVNAGNNQLDTCKQNFKTYAENVIRNKMKLGTSDVSKDVVAILNTQYGTFASFAAVSINLNNPTKYTSGNIIGPVYENGYTAIVAYGSKSGQAQSVNTDAYQCISGFNPQSWVNCIKQHSVCSNGESPSFAAIAPPDVGYKTGMAPWEMVDGRYPKTNTVQGNAGTFWVANNIPPGLVAYTCGSPTQ